MLPYPEVLPLSGSLGYLTVRHHTMWRLIYQHYGPTLTMWVQMRFFWVMVIVFPFLALVTHIPTSHKSLHLPDVFCVPHLRKKLISIANLCKTNHISVEFFSSHFLVKDLRTGAPLMWGENENDVYCAALPCHPQVHVPCLLGITSLVTLPIKFLGLFSIVMV